MSGNGRNERTGDKMNMESLVALIQLCLGVLAGIIVIILMTVFVKGLDRLGGKKNDKI